MPTDSLKQIRHCTNDRPSIDCGTYHGVIVLPCATATFVPSLAYINDSNRREGRSAQCSCRSSMSYCKMSPISVAFVRQRRYAMAPCNVHALLVPHGSRPTWCINFYVELETVRSRCNVRTAIQSNKYQHLYRTTLIDYFVKPMSKL